MDFEFDGEVIHWRGPAPWFYVAMPEEASAQIKAVAADLTFGWGMIPAVVTIGPVRWYTACFERDGRYLVPLKAAVRRRAGIDLGDRVEVRVEVGGDHEAWARDPLLRIE